MRSRPALLVGALAVLAYGLGAALSGAASPWARRPLLDGLAPPTAYRWVRPPAALAQGNKPPASGSFRLRLGPGGSELGAFGTSDGQVNLVLGQGAVAASPGQTAVQVTVEPLDPARLATPPGLLVAGNAYRIQAAYRPSGRRVGAFAGESSVGLVYPLLSVPVAGAASHALLASADGRGWSRQESTDVPGSHQVSGPLRAPGYLEVGVQPAAAAAGGRSRAPLLAAAAVALLLVAGAVLARARLAGRRRPGARAGRAGRQPGRGRAPPARRRANPARRRRRR